MAEVPVQISGVLYDVQKKTQARVVLMGNASIHGLTPGGGPIIPPDTGGGGGDGIWGPTDPRPTPPIALPPDPPPELPPGTPPNSVVKPAPEGGWGYYTDANAALYGAYRPRGDEHGPR